MKSYIQVSKAATTFVGPDATELYRAVVLASSLKLWAKTKILPTRGVNLTRMLTLAMRYTGKQYPRSVAGATQAAIDVEIWINTMKTAMPIIQA